MFGFKKNDDTGEDSKDCPVENEEFLAYRYRTMMALLSLLLILLIVFLIFYFKNRSNSTQAVPPVQTATPNAAVAAPSGPATAPATAARPRFSDLDLSQFTK